MKLILYAPVQQLTKIYIDFLFENFTYAPFNCVYINEYSRKNGTSLRKYIIKDFKYYKSDKYIYYFYYNLENFASTYISISFKSNSTIDNVEIDLSFDGGLFYLYNGIIEELGGFVAETPYYLVIPASCNSKIKVELNTTLEDDLKNLDLNLTLFEYQEKEPDYFIYENQSYTNYTIDYIQNDDYMTISILSFNYLTKNINTNSFCVKIWSSKKDIDFLNATLSEYRYYFTLYDKKSLDIFDLKPNQTYHFCLEAKMNQLININY